MDEPRAENSTSNMIMCSRHPEYEADDCTDCEEEDQP